MTNPAAAIPQRWGATGAIRRHPTALVSRLNELITPYVAEGTRIKALRGRRSPYASTHVLEELDLELTDGSVRRLVLKGCGPVATGAARSARPSFVSDPYRELWAYEVALPSLGIESPILYGTLGGNRRSGDRLVLERVSGVELYQLGAPAAWQAAAGWLARLHARGSELADRFSASGSLLTQDAGLYIRWMSRARQQAIRGRRASRLAVLDRLGEPFRRAVRILDGAPRTLTHGEFYPSNILVNGVDGAPEPERAAVAGAPAIAAVDWESIGTGPGVLDLAAFTSGDWDGAEREAVVDAYVGAQPAPPAPPRRTDFDLALASARLVTAVQWLGWSDDWVPPPEHAHDWETEAIRAAERCR